MVARQNVHPQRRKQVSEQTWTCPGAPKSDCDCDQGEMGNEVSREIVVPQNQGCSERRRDRGDSQSITRHNSDSRLPGQPRNATKGHTLKSLRVSSSTLFPRNQPIPVLLKPQRATTLRELLIPGARQPLLLCTQRFA